MLQALASRTMKNKKTMVILDGNNYPRGKRLLVRVNGKSEMVEVVNKDARFTYAIVEKDGRG